MDFRKDIKLLRNRFNSSNSCALIDKMVAKYNKMYSSLIAQKMNNNNSETYLKAELECLDNKINEFKNNEKIRQDLVKNFDEVSDLRFKNWYLFLCLP